MTMQTMNRLFSVCAAALLLLTACHAPALEEITPPDTQEPEIVPERTTIPYSLKVGTESTRVTYEGNTYAFKKDDYLQVKGLGDRTDIEGTLTRSGTDQNSTVWSGTLSYTTIKGDPAEDNPQLEITLVHADNTDTTTYAKALVGSAPQGTDLLKSAVERYSLFKTKVAFNTQEGTLLQQAAFMQFAITFKFDGTHEVGQGGDAKVDLQTSRFEAFADVPFVRVAEGSPNYKVNFIAVVPGGQSLSDFSLTVADREITFKNHNTTLTRNTQYTITREITYGPQLGDPFWSDGTYGRMKHPEGSAQIVGIIVYVNHNFSDPDKKAIDDAITEADGDDFGHGLVMALKNIDSGAGIAWSNPATQGVPFTTTVTTPSQTMDVASLSGYNNTTAIINGFASTTVVSAASKAQSYNAVLSEGHNTTGWFLPSIGQWMFAISIDGFGGANHTDLWTNNAKPPKNWKRNGSLSDLIRVMSNGGEDNNLLVDSLNERLEKLSREFSCQYDPFGIPKTGSTSSVNYSDNYWSSSEYSASQAFRMNFGSVEEDYATIKVKPENKNLTCFLNDSHYPAKVRPFLAF